MNKLFSIFIIFTVVVLSCKTTNKVSQSTDPKGVQLKKNQMAGIVILKGITNESRSTQSSIKELFFKINEKDYFIKISEGYVAKDIISKYIDKQIIIKGEIKTGEWETPDAGSLKDGTPSKKARSGEYIVINKIYNSN